jgi:hypothetical protein
MPDEELDSELKDEGKDLSDEDIEGVVGGVVYVPPSGSSPSDAPPRYS